MTKVTILQADDWTAMYIGDERVDEGHSLQINAVVRRLQGVGTFEFRYDYIDGDDYERLLQVGRFPESLTEWDNG